MSSSANDSSIRFAEIVSHPDPSIDLARAALLFARHEYPDLDVEAYIGRLDALAKEVRREADPRTAPAARLSALNRTLFEKEGFHGNTENYYDPRNSFLNEVLDRRTGIPITLSCVYIEVGRRVNLDIKGVGLPGHFIVKHERNGSSVFLDPFNGGRAMSQEECRRKAQEIMGDQFEFRPCLLEPCSTKQILARMLGNLKGIYLRARDFDRALWAVEDLLAIDPRCVEQIRDRGMIHLHLQLTAKAIADLESYLQAAPHADDASDICAIVRKLRALHAGLN